MNLLTVATTEPGTSILWVNKWVRGPRKTFICKSNGFNGCILSVREGEDSELLAVLQY